MIDLITLLFVMNTLIIDNTFRLVCEWTANVTASVSSLKYVTPLSF